MRIESTNMKTRRDVDVIIIGHFSVDKNVWTKGKIENVLGGAPTYSGSTFAILGKETGIFSAVGKDHLSEALSFCGSKNIDTTGLHVFSERTMAFQNSYNEDGRRKQRCLDVGPKLLVKNMPKKYMDSKAFYISPLAGEVDGELLRGLRRRGNIIMLDPQGLMRKISKNGDVDIALDRNMLDDVFRLVDIVKIGKDEIEAFEMEEKEILSMLAEKGVRTSIITRGKDTTMVLHDNKFFEAKTLDVAVEDPTGAGDVFGAAFLSEYMARLDVEEAVKFATTAAALKIEHKGPSGFPSREEIVRNL